MGYWSDKALELAAPDRLTPQPRKFVSAACFQDDALRAFIANNACSRTCSYTGRRSRKDIAAPLDLIAQRIFEALSLRYDDAANGVGWDEGAYVGATIWDTYDLLEEVLEFGPDASHDLFTDLIKALPQWEWSLTDPYGPRGHEVLRWSWDDFVNTVKHARRFFFNARLTASNRHDEKVSPAELLKEVAKGCEQAGLLRVLAPGQRFFRCRARPDRKTRFTLPRDIGPPPSRVASQSRMSPAGIPMFYGARTRATALAETLGSDDERYAIAEFRTTRAIRVLDLTVLPDISLFDIDRSDLFDWAIFMRSFAHDFRRPVSRNGSEHIDYVPTQVVTEYFRAIVRHKGCPLDGVLYFSARCDQESCVVLFAEQEDVSPDLDSSSEPIDKGFLLTARSISNRRRTVQGPDSAMAPS